MATSRIFWSKINIIWSAEKWKIIHDFWTCHRFFISFCILWRALRFEYVIELLGFRNSFASKAGPNFRDDATAHEHAQIKLVPENALAKVAFDTGVPARNMTVKGLFCSVHSSKTSSFWIQTNFFFCGTKSSIPTILSGISWTYRVADFGPPKGVKTFPYIVHGALGRVRWSLTLTN